MINEFYLDVDTSRSAHTYSLRIRTPLEDSVGPQIATFNPHACIQRPGLMEKIVDALNEKLVK